MPTALRVCSLDRPAACLLLLLILVITCWRVTASLRVLRRTLTVLFADLRRTADQNQ
jgi:hypothetical protein